MNNNVASDQVNLSLSASSKSNKHQKENLYYFQHNAFTSVDNVYGTFYIFVR